MTLLEAHGRFALMTDRDWFPCAADVTTPGADYFPATCAGLADLSGWLDDAETDEELQEAALHGLALYRGEMVSHDDVRAAVSRVVVEVMRWAEQTTTKEAAPCSDDS